MITNRICNILRMASRICRNQVRNRIPRIVPFTAGLVTVACEQSQYSNTEFNEEGLEHEFLIRQATTVNVNAASQLLTVTIVAIQDTSERLRKALTKEIALVQQAMEWGEGTPPEHWDDLVAVRGTLSDLYHNLRILFGYMDYVEKLATAAAEISFLSGNVVASDAICERIDHATRTRKLQETMNHDLQNESLEMQQQAITIVPTLHNKIIEQTNEQTTVHNI